MTRVRSNLRAGLILAILAAGCGTNKPLPEPSLLEEAASYTAAFERDMKLGRYQLALTDARKALDISRILDRDDQVALSLNNLGTVQERLGITVAAEDAYREAMEISRRADAVRTLAVSINNLAGMIVETDPEQARVLALEVFEMGRSRSWEDIMARALNTRARAALERGTAGEARTLCDRALELALKAHENGIRAACLVTRGRIEALAGDVKSAVSSVEEALAIDRELADPYAIAMDYRRLAEIHDGAGEGKAAGISLEKADRIFRILGIGGKYVEGTGGKE